jgi:hypothetical protein
MQWLWGMGAVGLTYLAQHLDDGHHVMVTGQSWISTGSTNP